MAIVLDAGALYASFDEDDSWNARVLPMLRAEKGPLILPAPVITEVDYLLTKFIGREARMDFYRSLVAGRYLIVDLTEQGYRRVEELNRRYADLDLGFVDAAIITVSEMTGVRRIATVDRRDFTPLAAAFGLELFP